MHKLIILSCILIASPQMKCWTSVKGRAYTPFIDSLDIFATEKSLTEMALRIQWCNWQNNPTRDCHILLSAYKYTTNAMSFLIGTPPPIDQSWGPGIYLEAEKHFPVYWLHHHKWSAELLLKAGLELQVIKCFLVNCTNIHNVLTT